MRAALAVAAAALCGIIAWEAVSRPGAAASLPPLKVAAIASRPGPDPSRPALALQTALARPVFAATRRPPAPADAPPGSPDAPEALLPRLSGIVTGPNGRAAVLADAAAGANAKPVVVLEGGRIATWTVRAIGDGQVRLDGPDGERTLSPAFSPASRAPHTPATTAGLTPLLGDFSASPMLQLRGMTALLQNSPTQNSNE